MRDGVLRNATLIGSTGNRGNFNTITIALDRGEIQVVNCAVTVSESCAMALVVFNIDVVNRTTAHCKAAGILFRPLVRVDKDVSDFTTIDRSKSTIGICADPKVGSILRIVIVLERVADLIAGDRAGVHFELRSRGHVDARNIRTGFTAGDGCTVDNDFTCIAVNNKRLSVGVQSDVFKCQGLASGF